MAKEGQAIALRKGDIDRFKAYLGKTRHPIRDKAIFMLTIKTGMRIGSIAKLKMADILSTDSTLKEVVILRSSITKGGKIITSYFTNSELREAMEDYLRIRKQRGGNSRTPAPDNVFLSQKGTPFSPNSLSNLMLKHYNAAGLEGCSSHSGRISFCTALLKKKVDIVAVSKVMGHSSIMTTQRYVHHNQEELGNIVKGL